MDPTGSAYPLHVAIIMDGNGRWAAARGLPRAEGHRRGVEALRRAVRAAHELGIVYLTIFSFSSENWSRPADRDRRSSSACSAASSARPRRRCTATACGCASSASATGLEPDICAIARRGRGTDRATTPASRWSSPSTTARATRSPAAAPAAGAARLPTASATLPRSTPTRSASISIRRTFPIPTSSSAPAASSGCRTSCCGRRPMPNWCSADPLAGLRRGRAGNARSPNMPGASAASAALRKPDRDASAKPRRGAGRTGVAQSSDAPYSPPRCWRRSAIAHRVCRRLAVGACW